MGASGSGKSSVARAGLVPVLRKSRDRVWEIATIVPTDRPVHALSAGLIPLFESDMSETDRLIETTKLADALLASTVKLRDVVDRVLVKEPGTDRLLLLVDQWEELFTLCHDDRARRCFIDNVLDATTTARLSVVLTLRGDFFGRAITNYRPLSDRVQGAQVNLGPMKRDELRLAIEGPARQVGLTFEAGLVDLILEHAGDEPGRLPLLEFVLRQMWDHRRGGELHHKAYTAIGQLEGAIARKAELLYLKASEEDRRRIQQIFFRLVRPGEGEADTRRRATFAELGEGLQGLVKTLTDERLLVTSQLTVRAEETIEVSHEALIRHWDRLKGWVDDDRQFLAWQQRLGASIKEWERSKQSADLLLRGLALTDALDWLQKKPDQFSPGERQFVTASRNRKWRSRGVAAILGGIVILLILEISWLWQRGYNVEQAILKVQSLVMSIHVEPMMISISGGTFRQGDINALGGAFPVREVAINSFAIGKYEVTFEEYDRFAIAMDRDLPGDQGWGRGQRPVINVSWEDVKEYAAWLSDKSGKRFRLPTESEWEYAARSGDTYEIWAGTSDEKLLADYAVYSVNSENLQNGTAMVGQKKPNGFGLHDMSGNAWEWVKDCWHNNYEGAPTDGSAWLETRGGDCGRRVLRGGSWGHLPVGVRSSSRYNFEVGFRIISIGFRLAQDLP